VAARRTPGRGVPASAVDLERSLAEEGLRDPRWWSNVAGDTYGWHDHPYHKVLYCAEGGITFHLRDGDVELGVGDRLDIEPGTEHAATVGPVGVTCVEAPRPA
jgi:mannose-6-phosphate isomerase-like protein (cupin superfamily)